VLVCLADIIDIAAFFAILFTKRFPKGIFDFALISLHSRRCGRAPTRTG
jgi:hypothetical protein